MDKLNDQSNGLYFEVSRPVKLSPDHDRLPVILVHGLAASHYDWLQLTPELTGAGYTVYALDLLGHGKSHKPAEPDAYTVDNVFQTFCDWIDSLLLNRPFILLGHSLGAYLAIQYAVLHPNRIAALILSDPFYSLNQLPPPLRYSYKHATLNTTIIGHAPEWLVRVLIDMTSLSIRNGYTLPENVRKQTAADYKRSRPEIFNIINTIQDLTPQLSAIQHPTLVMWGAQDFTLNPSFFTKAVQEIPHATGVAITGAGHVPHQSHAAEFNRNLLEFLASLPPGTAS